MNKAKNELCSVQEHADQRNMYSNTQFQLVSLSELAFVCAFVAAT